MFAKTLVTIIAVNIEEITPIDSVTANPLIGPVPKIKSIIKQLNSDICISNCGESFFIA